MSGLVRTTGPEDWHPYPCHSLCSNCGFLLPDTQGGDPFRDRPDPGPCPSCRTKAWIDLRHLPTVESLHEVDAFDAPARASTGKRLGRRIWAGVASAAWIAGVFVILWAVVVAHTFDPFYLTILGAGLFPIVMRAITAFRDHMIRSRRKALPARWRLALPEPEAQVTKTLEGTITPQAELLDAPLTVRPCIAYEVGVRTDDDGDADMGTWLLMEQRSIPFAIDGTHVGTDRAHLDVAPRQLDASKIADPILARFLRERGLDPLAPGLMFFEAVIEAEDRCEVRFRSTGVPVLAQGD